MLTLTCTNELDVLHVDQMMLTLLVLTLNSLDMTRGSTWRVAHAEQDIYLISPPLLVDDFGHSIYLFEYRFSRHIFIF